MSGEVVDQTTAGHASLIAVRDHPLVAASPLWALVPAVTPSSSVYVRSNFPTPAIDVATYRLLVEGAVERPLQFSLDELQQFPTRTLVMTMECAGNDRLGMRPVPEGEPWNQGAVSTVRWRGIALFDVLRAAGIASSAIEVVAWGADQGLIDERTTHFARSLPLPVALEQDTLLAFELNDTPLTPHHGFPVRLVVPGWYGMASVKWLAKLELVTTPFTGYFQRKRYVYDVGGRIEPVTRMRVKSIITSPGRAHVALRALSKCVAGRGPAMAASNLLMCIATTRHQFAHNSVFHSLRMRWCRGRQTCRSMKVITYFTRALPIPAVPFSQTKSNGIAWDTATMPCGA